MSLTKQPPESACPDVSTLMDSGAAGAHLAECAACRAIAALADQHRAGLHADPVECVEVDAWLAAQLLGEVDEQREIRLRAHVISCAACLALAQEVSEPGVADAVFDLGALRTSDFADLRTVELDNYTRGAEIGRGGMGRIVRARDRRLGRAVAIKELLDDKLRARFEREARLTARLQHPAIVNIHEAGRWPSGAPFYVMKYVAGEPLERRIARTRTLAERLALLPNVITVVEALAYAHSERIIHRDLKPANILVGPFGETVVIDWGLAKDLDERVPEPSDAPYRGAAPVTTVGGIGTPQYMPPEQAEEHLADPRLDVYALGATLYHVLSGRPPFGDVSSEAALELLLGDGPPPLSAVAPDVPQELTAIVAKAMARNPEQRYASAAELADELKRFETGQLVSAHHYSLGDLWGRWLRKHRAPIALATVFVVLLGGIGATSVSRVYAARRNAEQQLAELLLERGERELSERQPSRALVYLDAAAKLGVDTPALRYLIGEARRPVDALDASFQLDGTIRSAAVSSAGDKVAVGYYDDGRLRPPEVWDVHSGKRLATLGSGAASARTDLVDFSPDGKLVLTSNDAAHLWDATTGALVATLTATPAFAAAFTADGERVTTVSRTDGTNDRVTIVSWDRSGGKRSAIDVPMYAKDYDAISADGRRVLAIGKDYRGQIWDLASGALIATLDEMPALGAAPVATFDPSGKHLLVAWSTEARIFDAATGHTLERFPSDPDVIQRARLEDDGSLLLVSLGRGARLWPVDESGKRLDVVTLQHAGPPVDQAVRAANGDFVTSSPSGGVRFWGRRGEPRDTTLDLNATSLAALHVDGGRVVTVGDSGVVTVWDLRSGYVPVATNRTQNTVFDGRGHVVTVDQDGVSVWGLADGARVASTTELQVGGSNGAVGVSADGGAVVGADYRGRVQRWDLHANTVAETSAANPDTYLGHHFQPSAFTPDGERIVEGGLRSEENRSRIVATDGTVVAALTAARLTLAPRGDVVAGLVHGATEIGMWDVRTGAETHHLKLDLTRALAAIGPSRDVKIDQILIPPRADRVLTPLTREHDLVAVWDLNGRPLVAFEVGQATSLKLSPDGELLLVKNLTALTVWRVETGTLVSTMQLSHDAFFGDEPTFSTDGELVVSTSSDLQLQVWEARTGQLLSSRPMPAYPAKLAVAPDGEHLIVDWRGAEVDSAIFTLHQGPLDRAALAALVAKIPYRLDGGRLVPR